jgi:PAS domain S-box-containing protein
MDRIGWRAVQDPSDADRVAEKFQAAINDGHTWDDTFLLRRHDSEMRWHLAQALPLRDDRGEIVRWFGTHTDITAQRDAEESLRLSEERFRIMADSAPTLIWLAGADKLRSWFNKPWLDFTGRTMEQERGAGWLEGVHPDDMERCLQTYSDAFENRARFQLEYRLRRHDGQYRWMLAHGLPLHSAGGRFAGLIGSCVDITDQVLARQTLERQQALLEEAVRARTAELQASNERLRLAERMASLGTLSAGLGHDMGNLLVPLRVRLESLSRAALPEELREDVEAIRSSAEYLQRLASGLRMLAIDPRRVSRAEAAELTAWWAEVEPLLKNALPRNIELHAHMPAAECRVAISRAALTQAVFNLVQNAGDALRARGHGAVTISAQPNDDHVLLTVSDNGPGMSDEVKGRCMEPFFTTKTRGISTGLGLALVYGLIQEADGSVEIKTTDGGGATFLLSLRHAPALSQRPGQGKVALVALSDPRLRALVTSELRAMEFSIRPPDADTATVNVIVTENPSLIPATASRGRLVVLLADQHAHPADGVVVLGSKPRLQAIRDVLRRIANEDRR